LTLAAPERWLLVIELPADVANAGRFVARVLKCLKRTLGVRCRAVRLDVEQHVEPSVQAEKGSKADG
jgi:hypothetical protein